MGSVDRLARALGRAAQAASLGSRTLTLLDTNPVPSRWRHITKIDPENEKKLPLLYPLYLSHTSAVSVGGSRDVNSKNTEETFDLLEYADVPAFHEPSAARHVTERTQDRSHFLAIPEVLNGDSEALIGTLGEGTEYLRKELVPPLLETKIGWVPAGIRERLADFVTSWLLERAVFEAYIIQNPESAAAREAGVAASDVLTPVQAAQRAQAAERHLESEVVYVEYSGTFGGDEAVAVLEAITDAISWPRVWYGGGLSSREDATTVLDSGADAVIVGNVFHDIALEEREVCRVAVDELANDPEEGAVGEWVEASVDVESSSVYRYLSTIPSVSAPESLTTQYIEATVRTKLGLERLLGDARGEIEDPDTLKRFADRNAGPARRWLALSAQQPPPGGDRFLKGLINGYLGRELGIEAVMFPVDHLGALVRH